MDLCTAKNKGNIASATIDQHQVTYSTVDSKATKILEDQQPKVPTKKHPPPGKNTHNLYLYFVVYKLNEIQIHSVNLDFSEHRGNIIIFLFQCSVDDHDMTDYTVVVVCDHFNYVFVCLQRCRSKNLCFIICMY